MQKMFIVSVVLLAACGPKTPQPVSHADSPGQPVTKNTESDDFSTPEAAVRVFIQACAGKDVDLLSRSFSSSAEGEFSAIVQKTAAEKDLDELKAMFEGASLGETSMGQDGNTAAVKVNLASREETLHLVKEGDAWKITGF